MKFLLTIACCLFLLSSVLANELYSRPNADLGESSDGFVKVDSKMARRDDGAETNHWDDGSHHHRPPPPHHRPPPPPHHRPPPPPHHGHDRDHW